MRQVLPSLLKIPHRGQESSICEFEKGAGGGRPGDASRLSRSVFSKSSFSKLTPHISIIFVHDESIPKKKAFSSPRLKKFRRGSGGRAPTMALDAPRTGARPSSDDPRCTVNRDATPPGGLSGAERQVRGQLDELCDVFSPDSPPSRGLGLSFENKAPGQLKASWITLRNGSAQLVQLTTKWRGHGIWRRCGRGRVLRPASAWDRGRVIHLILLSRFGYGIPLCEYEVATFVETEPQPSFMDSSAYPCNNQEAESYRGDKAKGDSIVV